MSFFIIPFHAIVVHVIFVSLVIWVYILHFFDI